jgi:hypothetical protein
VVTVEALGVLFLAFAWAALMGYAGWSLAERRGPSLGLPRREAAPERASGSDAAPLADPLP